MHRSFHNYVVEQLALVNEHGRFTRPSDKLTPEQAEAAWKKYDNGLFQTGRLYDQFYSNP
jgi:linoleate 10R-lipoxygenase